MCHQHWGRKMLLYEASNFFQKLFIFKYVVLSHSFGQFSCYRRVLLAFYKAKDSIFCQVLYMKPIAEPENEGTACELPCGASKRVLYFFFFSVKVDSKLKNKSNFIYHHGSCTPILRTLKVYIKILKEFRQNHTSTRKTSSIHITMYVCVRVW